MAGEVHACETFDFPLANGVINYSITKKIVPKAGGTWQIAELEAIAEARQQGEDAGKAKLKNETCASPCECLIFVDTSIKSIVPTWAAGKKGKLLDISITGTWEAGILCFKPKEKGEEQKSGSEGSGKGKGGKSDSGGKEKKKDKDNDKNKSNKSRSGGKEKSKSSKSTESGKQNGKGKVDKAVPGGKKKSKDKGG